MKKNSKLKLKHFEVITRWWALESDFVKIDQFVK